MSDGDWRYGGDAPQGRGRRRADAQPSDPYGRIRRTASRSSRASSSPGTTRATDSSSGLRPAGQQGYGQQQQGSYGQQGYAQGQQGQQASPGSSQDGSADTGSRQRVRRSAQAQPGPQAQGQPGSSAARPARLRRSAAAGRQQSQLRPAAPQGQQYGQQQAQPGYQQPHRLRPAAGRQPGRGRHARPPCRPARSEGRPERGHRPLRAAAQDPYGAGGGTATAADSYGDDGWGDTGAAAPGEGYAEQAGGLGRGRPGAGRAALPGDAAAAAGAPPRRSTPRAVTTRPATTRRRRRLERRRVLRGPVAAAPGWQAARLGAPVRARRHPELVRRLHVRRLLVLQGQVRSRPRLHRRGDLRGEREGAGGRPARCDRSADRERVVHRRSREERAGVCRRGEPESEPDRHHRRAPTRSVRGSPAPTRCWSC